VAIIVCLLVVGWLLWEGAKYWFRAAEKGWQQDDERDRQERIAFLQEAIRRDAPREVTPVPKPPGTGNEVSASEKK
jgi:hypothetical protein